MVATAAVISHDPLAATDHRDDVRLRLPLERDTMPMAAASGNQSADEHGEQSAAPSGDQSPYSFFPRPLKSTKMQRPTTTAGGAGWPRTVPRRKGTELDQTLVTIQTLEEGLKEQIKSRRDADFSKGA